ncbi:MAG TPA: rRNA pseudouridine synthase, partial [Candidatus Peregrinibacteria bacterium]|nr:rRNA pseudouridine synthase [Candidatus Peregrinibacteria bacterium]
MRLNKFIASTGHCSRRQADELISEGRVKINGKTASLGTQVDPQEDSVKIGSKLLQSHEEKVVIILNKPKGFTCTKKDPHAKRTVMELLPKNLQHLFPVGRLDKDTEGLLIMTNDGELTNQLTHPRYGVEKEYEVLVKRKVEEKTLEKIQKGVRLRDYRTQPAEVKIVSFLEDKTLLQIILTEGKKREVRNLMYVLGHPVKKLERIRFGKIHLKGLARGTYRFLDQGE